MMIVILLVLLLTGCTAPEEYGVKLRRECESAYTEFSKLDTGMIYGKDYWVGRCMDTRLKR